MTHDTPTPDKLTRLNVNINEECYLALRKTIAQRGITMTEAIRRAISVYDYIQTETDHGGKLLIERDGTYRELVLL